MTNCHNSGGQVSEFISFSGLPTVQSQSLRKVARLYECRMFEQLRVLFRFRRIHAEKDFYNI